MIFTTKDNVWNCLVLLYELDINARSTVMNNTNKKCEMRRHSLKRNYFDTVILKKESIYGNSYGC